MCTLLRFNDSADGKAVQKKMSQFTEDPELYTNLTDHVFQQILTSSSAKEDSQHPTEDTTDPEKLKMVWIMLSASSTNMHCMHTNLTPPPLLTLLCITCICRLRSCSSKSKIENSTNTLENFLVYRQML